jgi:hypothetical protein
MLEGELRKKDKNIEVLAYQASQQNNSHLSIYGQRPSPMETYLVQNLKKQLRE